MNGRAGPKAGPDARYQPTPGTIHELRLVRVRRELKLAREQLEAARMAGDESVIAVWERTVGALEQREREALR